MAARSGKSDRGRQVSKNTQNGSHRCGERTVGNAKPVSYKGNQLLTTLEASFVFWLLLVSQRHDIVLLGTSLSGTPVVRNRAPF